VSLTPHPVVGRFERVQPLAVIRQVGQLAHDRLGRGLDHRFA